MGMETASSGLQQQQGVRLDSGILSVGLQHLPNQQLQLQQQRQQ
jgi:hypothetical protein